MEEQIMDEVLARQFLLGQLSLEDHGRIEELAFTDPETFTFLQAAEDDLIDEFVYDDLSADERDRFEKHFLAQPGRRRDLRIARALRHSLEQEQVSPSLWKRLQQWFHPGSMDLVPALVTAALIIAAIIGLVFLVRTLFYQRSGPPVQVQQQQPPPLPTPTTTASETPAPASPSPAHRDNDNKAPQSPHRQSTPLYAMLVPGGPTRSEGGETAVSRSSAAAGLYLPLVSVTSYRSYEATLEMDGKVVKTWANLKPTKSGSVKVIRVSVPSNVLQLSQRYKFVLNGVAGKGDVRYVESYYFRLTN